MPGSVVQQRRTKSPIAPRCAGRQRRGVVALRVATAVRRTAGLRDCSAPSAAGSVAAGCAASPACSRSAGALRRRVLGRVRLRGRALRAGGGVPAAAAPAGAASAAAAAPAAARAATAAAAARRRRRRRRRRRHRHRRRRQRRGGRLRGEGGGGGGGGGAAAPPPACGFGGCWRPAAAGVGDGRRRRRGTGGGRLRPHATFGACPRTPSRRPVSGGSGGPVATAGRSAARSASGRRRDAAPRRS